ncbi:MAG: hypothetical protein GX592_04035 [Clostridiales bacterium]|nr:hypothetical protein [Clostridiales bacterium]
MRKLKGWRLVLFSASGFGPNLLMTLVTAYLLNALVPAGIVENLDKWSLSGTAAPLVAVGLFSVLFTLAKVIDGAIDIPLAFVTDSMRAKYGKRRLSMLIGFVPMVAAYALLWHPLRAEASSVFNAIATFAVLLVFFSSYTLCLVSYYGCYAHIVSDGRDRAKLAGWKAFFDTVNYSVAYALLPMFVSMGFSIKQIVLGCMPLMLTMLIPQFLVKEDGSLNRPEARVPFLESLKRTFAHRDFRNWLVPLFFLHFGLMMFLAGQGTLAAGAMQLQGWQITVMNTAAFAPVPLMLLWYNHIQRKRSTRFAFQAALLAFAVAMLFFELASTLFFPGEGRWLVRLMIGITGSTIGSFSIGAFFAVPYQISSQIAANELRSTGKDHSAMYFAVQGLVTQVASAVSTGVVYLNVKSISIGGNAQAGIEIVPLIVAAACVLSFMLSFGMRRNYAPEAKGVDA